MGEKVWFGDSWMAGLKAGWPSPNKKVPGLSSAESVDLSSKGLHVLTMGFLLVLWFPSQSKKRNKTCNM